MKISLIIKTILTQVAVREAIVATITELKKIGKNKNLELLVNKNTLESGISNIVEDSLKWSEMLNSLDFSHKLFTEFHYVGLNFYLTPVRNQFSIPEEQEDLVSNIVTTESNSLIILGGPGSGKTSSMKMFVRNILTKENFLPDYCPIPIVIRLRELKHKYPTEFLRQNKHLFIYILLSDIFNIKYKNEESETLPLWKSVFVKETIYNILRELKCILILDGFDEFDYEFRTDLLQQIKDIRTRSSIVTIITSRTGEFHYNLVGFSKYQIAPLNKGKIIEFVNNYLGQETGETFYTHLVKTPYYDTAIKPLILTFLCLIFYFEKSLPAKPRYIYKDIISLLFAKWDRNRGFSRLTKFEGFDKNAKEDFMSVLAFELIKKNKLEFDREDLEDIYTSICKYYDLLESDFESVFDEIEENSGLFIKAGMDRYQFPHKSIQEYLGAQYLNSFSSLNKFEETLRSIPHESALLVALSRNANERLKEVLSHLKIGGTFELDYLWTFVDRLNIELPRFVEDLELAIFLCTYFFEVPNHIRNNTLELAMEFINFEGIHDSFIKLGKFYKVESNSKIDMPDNAFVKLSPKKMPKK